MGKSDKWIRRLVSKGYNWSWKKSPLSKSKIIRSRDNLDSAMLKVLDDEVADAIQAGALHPVKPNLINRKVTCVSNYFAVPKPASPGQWRPIIDLRFLNKFLSKKKFKLTKYSDVAMSISKDCWMVTIDLTKAYFAVPIRETLWPFFENLLERRVL